MDLDEFLDGGFEAAAAAADSSGSDGGDGGSSDDGECEGDSSGDLDDVTLSDDEEDDEEGAAAADAAGSSEEEEEEDEEGDGDGEAAAVAADNARLSGAVSRHKAQLESLREKDPEFYAYLQVCVGGGALVLWGRRDLWCVWHSVQACWLSWHDESFLVWV